jgi:pimeloyl-ACP methyl ester carboxylesterase
MSDAAEAQRSIWRHLMTTPFRQDWVDIDGISTRYVQAGKADAPAIVMLHGTAGTWECFAANLGAHAQHYNCYALDMVGSGFSSKPDMQYEIPVYAEHVRKFMAKMGLKSASLIGVSLGAWVACRIAVDHPEIVDKLTLVASSGMFANATTMGSIRGVRTKAVDDPSWETIKSVFVPLIYDEHNRIPDLVAVRQATYRLPEMKTAMHNILCLQDPEIRQRNLLKEGEWRSITAPTLVIAAPDDREEYYNTAMRMRELAKDVRVVEVREVKHWGQFEKPDLFNKLNLAFMSGAELPAQAS